MKKHIYIVLYTLSIGGAERHASSIANFLSESGYKVTIILLEDNKIDYRLSDDINVLSFRDVSFPPEITNYKADPREKILLKAYKLISNKKHRLLDKSIYIRAAYEEKLKWIFNRQIDISNSVVISFMTIPNLCAAKLKTVFHYDLIMGEFTAPQLEFTEEAPENQLKRAYYPNADAFVFQTEEQKNFYSYLLNVEKQIIPNPIKDILTEPYCGEREKTIVNYCKHVKAKNLPLLIEAFAKLSVEYPDYSLIIYGDGPEKENTQKCIGKFDLNGRAILKPYEMNILETVRKSTMFVSSSDREGISNSMLEAMAIGLPVVCTDCPAGGARMFIRNYENGMLVPMRDPEALYQAMKFIIENPEKAQKMANKAIEIKTVLNKQKILNKWLELIERY